MVGYVQAYTGSGKRKTAAAFGLAMQAIGAGSKIYIARFVKENGDSPLHALKKISDQVLLRKY